MVVIRPTRKLRAILPVSEAVGVSNTALGDWYVNRLIVDRQPLLLLVSSASLLSLVVRARNVRNLPMQLADFVADRLTRLGIATSLIEAERRAMTPVQIGATGDRSVLGIMVDFANGVPYFLESGWIDGDLNAVEDRLAENPCFAGKPSEQVVFPEKQAPALLRARWADSLG
jgi:hypothetical protein